MQAISNVYNNVKNAILSLLKFLRTGIGILTLKLALLLLLVFLIYILAAVFFDDVGKLLFGDLGTDEYNVSSGFLQNLANSGYDSMVNSEQLISYYSFEYAVLMDEAEYLEKKGITTIDQFNQAVVDWEHESLTNEMEYYSTTDDEMFKYDINKLKIWSKLAAKAMQVDHTFTEDINEEFDN